MHNVMVDTAELIHGPIGSMCTNPKPLLLSLIRKVCEVCLLCIINIMWLCLARYMVFAQCDTIIFLVSGVTVVDS